MNNRYFFPLHYNSGNRGCEAITKGTIKILNLENSQYLGFCTDINTDSAINLNHFIELYPTRHLSFFFRVVRKIGLLAYHNKEYWRTLTYKKKYSKFLNLMKYDDICLITGGDTLCYDDNEIPFIISECNKYHHPSIIWGCSFGKENFSQMKLNALKHATAITVRESITYEYLTNELHLNNITLVSDPAFSLNPEPIDLPDYFKNLNLVGINVSNFVIEPNNTIMSQLILLINKITEIAKNEVVFIPHVFWLDQDDRVVCNRILENIKHPDKVHILDSSQMNYEQIRYAISKCRFFIGARTHAMISAYSTCVPSIALGYSVKSLGIAKDLELNEKLVIDCRNKNDGTELIESFNYLLQHETEIRTHLVKVMPEYCQRAYKGKDVVDKIIESL